MSQPYPTEEIIVAGFGGQGVLLTGRLLCVAAMREGRYVSHIPSYGAEMRGGTANCSVVLSDESIASPIIEHPSIVIAMNEPSVNKFEPTIKSGGLLLWNSSLVKTPPVRKDIDTIPVPATQTSIELGSQKGANMTMLGALLLIRPNLVAKQALVAALDETVSKRNRKYNKKNIEILDAGSKYMQNYLANKLD